MDRVAAAARTADALRARLARGTGGPGHYSRELVARLALSLHLVKAGLADAFEDAAIEVALMVEPALESTGGDGKATRGLVPAAARHVSRLVATSGTCRCRSCRPASRPAIRRCC